MKIAIGCDHGGYLLKQDILIWLEENDIDFEDVGCYNRTTKTWMTLDQAHAYASTADLYVRSGVVRIIEVR